MKDLNMFIGVSVNEGAVISRNRLNASDVWVLNSTHWYIHLPLYSFSFPLRIYVPSTSKYKSSNYF
jgi:hypothetical protein